ncbi:cupin domain-containing protein [Pseudohongiella acticola]|jgi:AraC-like DNA-binding protein|uniref:cupin domain-containing protein n=1 Tax=Pseudohongiella acticola TaxID=1524254 RepID=UPI0030ED2763
MSHVFQPYPSSQRAISDLLRLLSATVDVFHNSKVCGQWRISEHKPPLTCFHLVTEGGCQLEMPGRLSTTMHAGDLILFPVELPHSLTPIQPLSGPQEHLPYPEAVNREGTGLLCASVSFRHPASELLLRALPDVTLLTASETPWLQPLTSLILNESLTPRSASKVILEKLAELLFAYTLANGYVANAMNQNFLALYVHPRLGRAIDAIHEQPEFPWTLELLARRAAQSRTAFAAAFKSISGWTVMEYLCWWRMQLGWKLLHDGVRLSEVPAQVGYQSPAAFSRAFKRCFGINPGAVRRW